MLDSVDRFAGDCPGKCSLPYPYDLDLSGVPHNLNRVNPHRLANDPITASFLAAGMRLLDQHLGPGHHCECAMHHDSSRLLSFLSQRNVVDALSGIDGGFPKKGGLSLLRDRWAVQKSFVADLIRFAVWHENYRPGYRQYREIATARLVRDEDFVQAIQKIAYDVIAEGVRLQSVRLSLALMAAAEDDPDITAAISAAYQDYLAAWRQLYGDVMVARGLRLRAGLTLDDLVAALSAATDGTTVRAIGDPAVSVIDHESRCSLMGTIALAIVNSFLERADDSDGLTLEQVVAKRLIR